MRFSGVEAFLMLQEGDGPGQNRIRIVPSQADAVKSWTRSTRISPIFGVNGAGAEAPKRADFSGHWNVIFLGPIHPESIIPLLPEDAVLWLTMGLFNIFLVCPSRPSLAAIKSHASNGKTPFELWTVTDGVVSEREFSELPVQNLDWRSRLADLLKAPTRPELREALHEYCPLMASTLARAPCLPSVHGVELLQINDLISQIVRDDAQSSNPHSSYQVLGEIFTINAALSRYSSQGFAGTTPISTTECHVWSHSLLGIGVALLALRNLRSFIQGTLGSWRLPERFSALRTLPGRDHSVLDLPSDVLGDLAIPGPHEPIIPLLTYFSGRDGYRSTETTLSAPIAAVGSCSSRRWSLLTLTHEISHVIIRAILADLFPDLSQPTDLEESFKLVTTNAAGHTLFDEIRRLLFFAIIKMDEAASGRHKTTLTKASDLTALIQRWRSDVDEIMVHVFDFLYFYGRDHERYIGGIWASWGTIPNISNRVRDYVVRTICAVMATLLRRREQAECLARETVLTGLSSLQTGGQGGRYVQEAISYIQDCWDSDILSKVRARRMLVQVVHNILFSERIATAVRGESQITGGETDTEGYPHRHGNLDYRPITNPVRFLEVFTEAREPVASDSTWLLYTMAFCYEAT